MSLTPFHIAFPVDDLEAARAFYGSTLGCAEGRSSSQWIDFDLFGHQIVAHLKPRRTSAKLITTQSTAMMFRFPTSALCFRWSRGRCWRSDYGARR